MKNLSNFFLLLTTFYFFSLPTTFAQEDTIPPVVKLFGSPVITLPCEGYYIEYGANAIDDVDGTVEVKREGSRVCTYEAGAYVVDYTATDKSGNTATESRLVVVQGDCSLHCGLIDDFDYAQQFITQNDTIQSSLNATITIPVLKNDCCGSLFVSITKNSDFGTSQVVERQAIEYTPNDGFIGVDTVHYETTNWWWTGARSAFVIIEVGATPIQSNPTYPSLQLFPNPAKDILTIDVGTDLAAKQDIQLLLFNTLGQLQSIHSVSNTGTSTIDIEGLEQGLYVFQLKAKEEVLASRKVIVE